MLQTEVGFKLIDSILYFFCCLLCNFSFASRAHFLTVFSCPNNTSARSIRELESCRCSVIGDKRDIGENQTLLEYRTQKESTTRSSRERVNIGTYYCLQHDLFEQREGKKELCVSCDGSYREIRGKTKENSVTASTHISDAWKSDRDPNLLIAAYCIHL